MLKDYENELNFVKESLSEIVVDIKDANIEFLENLETNQPLDSLRDISSRCSQIDNKLVLILAKYSPEASDLRSVVAYLKITTILVRIASNTRKLIKSFKEANIDNAIVNSYFMPMHKEAIKALGAVDEMLNSNSSDELKDIFNIVVISESKSDDFFEVLEENIVQKSGQDIDEFKRYQKLLYIARKSEKISDRALSISSLLLYAKVGGELL
jgi:phosphate transport system protein